MGAATVVNQETCTVEELASQINVWLKDKNKQETAARALSEWDMPDATFHIWSAVKSAAN
jgi:UDP-N-acetylglucosamine:LPS N-acetylglucosamine transferase